MDRNSRIPEFSNIKWTRLYVNDERGKLEPISRDNTTIREMPFLHI